MVKLANRSIGLEDFQEYLRSQSDLAFELQILKILKDENCKCSHGGAYDDPVSKKTREYDIRAELSTEIFKIKLAIECKNLRPNFPLLVSCIPRTKEEAFHQVCLGYPGKRTDVSVDKYLGKKISVNTFQFQDSQLYEIGKPVGKSCSQVGRTLQDKQITSSDSEIYDKWAQALSSSYDLLTEIYKEIEKTNTIGFCFFLPILVVPDDRLWEVQFSEIGDAITNPTIVNRCQYFVGKSFYAKWNWTGHSYTFSHLEIMTMTGLKNFFQELKRDNNLIAKIFPFLKNNEQET